MATSTQTPRVPATRGGRFLGFLAVGATGLVVNQLAFWALTDVFGLYYLWGFLLATQFSTAWNFVLLERFVFDGRREGRWARLGWYALMNNIWNVASVPVMYAITTGFGVAHLWANWFVISGMTVVRFAISNRLIWRERGTGTDPGGMVPTLRQSTWSYDIHGIVRIVSETPLPELERFEVPALLDVPDIEVSVSNRGFGGLRRRVSVTEADGHITYIEHLGRFGFAAKIDVETLSRIQVSKLLRRSPHVAYTNVVEPVVRWVMVRKGYILAHAACLQIDGHGVLITARTDTGKTTTCLMSIKQQGSGFVSDDMVIIDPEGRALSYPKPLTISSHTLHAVKGAPMSVAGRAALQVQGRLHSKFGRSVGMAFGNINLPVATMSALVQMAVPPPKFHVDRLIPEAELVGAARPRPARGDRARRRAPARARRGDRVRDLVGQHRGRLRVPAVPADRGRPHERPRGGRARDPSQGGQRARRRAAAHARPRVVRASAVARCGHGGPDDQRGRPDRRDRRRDARPDGRRRPGTEVCRRRGDRPGYRRPGGRVVDGVSVRSSCPRRKRRRSSARCRAP